MYLTRSKSIRNVHSKKLFHLLNKIGLYILCPPTLFMKEIEYTVPIRLIKISDHDEIYQRKILVIKQCYVQEFAICLGKAT